ncbi:MAG: fatty acid--CoA ligase family protein [Actinomycetota bacterium]
MWSSDIPVLRPGDVVAARMEPGPEWRGLVELVWGAGAALFPIDHRLPSAEVDPLLAAVRPAVLVDPRGGRRLDGAVPAPEGDAVLVATSGTAGAPKIVRLSRSSVDAAVAASALALEADPHDGWLCCLPLGHIGGLLVLLRSVLLGAPVAIHARFDPEAVAAVAGVRFVSLVPRMLARLLDRGVDVARFRTILVGGGALPVELRDRARGAGATVVETYGLTESCGGIVYGGVPLPGVGVRIGPQGGIQLSGAMLMRGYRFDEAATAAVFTPDGWLKTRDAGDLGPDGRLRVLGRMDEVIVTGGEKVWPAEIEMALRAHPKVAQVAVAGRPDEDWGARVVAWVVPADPLDPPTLGELREHVGGSLPRYRAPRELEVVDQLPRTALGKLRRSRLEPD